MSRTPWRILLAYQKLSPEDKNVYRSELVSKLESPSTGDRLAGLTALFVIRQKDLPSHLLRMAKDPSSSVRRLAVFYLGETRAKYSLGIISEGLQDKSPDVRAAAREAYKKLAGRGS